MGKVLTGEDSLQKTNCRVLVIDDSEIELKAYLDGLGKEFDVSFSVDARTVWELLHSAPLPDAIILGIILPNEDGELAFTGTGFGCNMSYALAAPAAGNSPKLRLQALNNIMLESQQKGIGKSYAINGIIGVTE
jgi:hypothetical protein